MRRLGLPLHAREPRRKLRLRQGQEPCRPPQTRGGGGGGGGGGPLPPRRRTRVRTYLAPTPARMRVVTAKGNGMGRPWSIGLRRAVHRGRVPVVAITAGTLRRFAGSAAG